MNYQRKSIKEVVSSTRDFQIRASGYDNNSRWVKDKCINQVPCNFLSGKGNLGNLLDAGAGTGYLSFYLSHSIPTHSVTMVDASNNMLQIAKERLPHAILINKSIESFCNDNLQKYDTILARQILHYVDDVNQIISLLKEKLAVNGLFYVGQFVVPDDESDKWHADLIQKISKNRKRSFTYHNFIDLFLKQGFKIIKCEITDYEENINDFFSRRTNFELSFDDLLQSSISSLNDNIRDNLSVRITKDNLYFSVQFCHLLLTYDR